jgi:hypothetical protein
MTGVTEAALADYIWGNWLGDCVTGATTCA